MKNYLFLNYYEELNKNNFLFNNDNNKIGDNLLSPFVEIKRQAILKNINVSSEIFPNNQDYHAVIFIDMPNRGNSIFRHALKNSIPMYLIILESKHTRGQNYKIKNHKYFKKIFTYDDDLVDDIKYIKINYSFEIPVKFSNFFDERLKLSVMIAGNKKSINCNELYSEREKVIRWFENNYPNDFDLYGLGWETYTFPPYPLIKVFNKSKLLKKIFHKKFISYKGPVERKNPILQKYKFSFCYENINNVPGYITEKIFDSMFAGCVPIYWGAPNISNYIPKRCFIDARKFSSIMCLHKYLSNMTLHEYVDYQNNIIKFLKSDECQKFSTKNFASTILNEINESQTKITLTY